MHSSRVSISNIIFRNMSSLRYTEPKEIKIPMPWGHVSAKTWGNSATGSPVLGLHGWMDNAGTFDRLVPLLTDRIYFVAVDLPGHGLSSHYPPGVQYHFADYLTVIKRIVTFLKWGRFSIVGHSMGGGLGSFFSAMYPSDVDRLVLLDIVKPISHDESTTSDSMRQSIEFFLGVEEKALLSSREATVPSHSYEDAMRRLILATDESLTEDGARCLMARGTVRVDEDKWTFRRDLRLRSPTMFRFRHDQSLHFLSTIQCHMLLVKAKDSPTYGGPTEVVQKTLDLYREKCASYQYLEVEGNHHVHLTHPHAMAEAVNSFLLKGMTESKASL